MVENKEERLNTLFYALSDSTRRAMLFRLSKGECNVSELADPFDMSLAAVSKHLKVLEEAGLVEKEKNGRTYSCRPHFEPLNEINKLLLELSEFWQHRLSALEKFLASESPKGGKQHGACRDSSNSKTSNKKNRSRKKRKGV